jgi:hypothetical protein
MLAVQMVATHFAATRALRRLKGSDTIPQQDSNGNLAAKLMRTFATQTEALQRYRGKAQQKVTVEHVHVHTGGQAIVGSVSQSGGGRDNDENCGQPHAPEYAGAITFAPGTTLPSADEAREAMPVASGSPVRPVAECMAARLAVEPRRGGATGNIVTEARIYLNGIQLTEREPAFGTLPERKLLIPGEAARATSSPASHS